MTDLKTTRARLLARQMGAEEGMEPGWQVQVAQRMGVSESVLSHLLSGARGVGGRTIQRIVDRTGVDAAFFFDATLGPEPRYRDHLARRKPHSRAPKPPAHWQDFLDSYPRVAELSPEELLAMQEFVSTHFVIRSWFDWAQLGEWMIEHKPRH